MMERTKIVQSPIPMELYRKLVNKTLDKNISIREALNQALESYVEVKN